MATLFPSLEEIDRGVSKPSRSERRLLEFLDKNLDSSYEVYHKPIVNGDTPDIVVLRKGAGVLIIECREWDLSSIEVLDAFTWKYNVPTGAPHVILSPLARAHQYKRRLTSLHTEYRWSSYQKNREWEGRVGLLVFFHGQTSKQVARFFAKAKKDCPSSEKEFDAFDTFNCVWSDESLTQSHLDRVLKIRRLGASSKTFDEPLYLSIRRYLQPAIHRAEEGIEINYTKSQRELIASSGKKQQKVRGVAGCGKTLVLAARAIEALKRTQGTVLILTFNVALRNYIRHRLNLVREEFHWNDFVILNYHEFFKGQAVNNYLKPTWGSYEDLEFFKPAQAKLRPFKAIFVDEIQDYEKKWVQILRRYFLSADGEFVVFGDEKQNVYGREMDAVEKKRPYTGIPGNWNVLKESFRMTTAITEFATMYQSHFLAGKYDTDEIVSTQIGLDLDNLPHSIEYYSVGADPSPFQLFQLIEERLLSLGVHPNDTAILSSTVQTGKEIDVCFRYLKREKTFCAFERYEEFWELAAGQIQRAGSAEDRKILNWGSQVALRDKRQLPQLLSILSVGGIPSEMWPSHLKTALKRPGEEILAWFAKLSALKFVGAIMKTVREDLDKEDSDAFERRLYDVRRNRKVHFHFMTGTAKLATVFSFKGWETDTLVLLLEREDAQLPFSSLELVYTGITRCRRNLVLVNKGNQAFEQFAELVQGRGIFTRFERGHPAEQPA